MGRVARKLTVCLPYHFHIGKLRKEKMAFGDKLQISTNSMAAALQP
jgi:hypothetical protein